jgi:hypothetical protein
MQKILLGIAFALGGIITYVATRPEIHFGGIAIALVVIAFLFGLIQSKYPWLFALALGIWIPVLVLFQGFFKGLFRVQNIWAILALLIAFAGAYAGAFVRNKFTAKTR